ncbi:hypothetical protein NC653_015140 [Populus alba x Populus x berolinensis]|uniref:Uncharacterized protein n=1 Tax=Populus alba x Populus x berolinensis TaxID=444605 RepID=A0AAD6QZ58_9ROSI|nr:hypothetical protein NC653_015140 [Populus alba x Populus x berolinensis]
MGVTSSYGHVINAESLKTSYPIGGPHRILTTSVTESLELNNWNHQTLECCVKNTDRLIEPYGRLGLLCEARVAPKFYRDRDSSAMLALVIACRPDKCQSKGND